MARTRHPQPFPWEIGHASPDDRAMGLELELIELVRRRGEAVAGSSVADLLDREIDRTVAELDELTDGLPVAV